MLIDQPSTGGQSEKSVLDHIASLKAGMISGKSLSPETRREVVEYLAAEGVGTTEIARLFGFTDRTIRRDLDAIRERNALQQDPKLVERITGELDTEAHRCIQRIRKVTNDKKASHSAKIEGERALFQILNDLAERLQSLGYLPSAAQWVQADLTHHLGDVPSLDRIAAEIQRVSGFTGHDKNAAGELGRLAELTEQASIASTSVEENSSDSDRPDLRGA